MTNDIGVDLAVPREFRRRGARVLTQIEVDLSARVIAKTVRQTRDFGREEARIEIVLADRS